jgi:hypothetical protein
MITASAASLLPSLGQPIDVTVSSVGNAKSLRGGTLLMTQLKGADGQVYAIAQGNVLVGGVGASSGGSKVTVNHLSAGRIPGGATVERAVPTQSGRAAMFYYELAESILDRSEYCGRDQQKYGPGRHRPSTAGVLRFVRRKIQMPVWLSWAASIIWK